MTYSRDLYHYGVIGMKWGVRRYQNEDGTLTEVGKQRLKKWKEKEEDNVRSKYKKRIDSYEKKASTYKNKGKYNKAKEYIKIAKYSKRTLKTELSKIKNYSLDDVNKENKQVGKKIVGDILLYSLGSAGLSMITGGATPLIVPIENANQIRTNIRISEEEDNENYKAVFGENKPTYKPKKK